jgi:hypothetical protein
MEPEEGEAGESQTVLAVPTAAVIRDELHQLVLADLLGPLGGEFEEFGNERPTDRYILGRLAPEGTVIEPDTQDETTPIWARISQSRPRRTSSAWRRPRWAAPPTWRGISQNLRCARSGRGTGGRCRRPSRS